ncbi:MAG: hypothetical protein IT293_05460 [Deltaproteobacteria bacterium]|nr:hypothetical protein [Deltaproteobacteria bacterium]
MSAALATTTRCTPSPAWSSGRGRDRSDSSARTAACSRSTPPACTRRRRRRSCAATAARSRPSSTRAPPCRSRSSRGRATVESFTVVYGKEGRPATGVVVARLADGARCTATTRKDDAETVARLCGHADPLGAIVETSPGGEEPSQFVFAS